MNNKFEIGDLIALTDSFTCLEADKGQLGIVINKSSCSPGDDGIWNWIYFIRFTEKIRDWVEEEHLVLKAGVYDNE